jgi:hypothetical protein
VATQGRAPDDVFRPAVFAVLCSEASAIDGWIPAEIMAVDGSATKKQPSPSLFCRCFLLFS